MTRHQRIEFPNHDGEMLAASLALPDRPPRAYALFAHCFTCGKDIAAASRISRTLAGNGIAVLSFDFTGLGGSEGDFANTNFASNVDDLVAATEYLRAEHTAPALLIGHSLGGTAVLAAAARVPEAKAVVAIASPASPAHVIKQFAGDVDTITTKGEATVSLAGRDFRIKQQFIDDLTTHPIEDRLKDLKKSLLIFHAPLDPVVSVDEAGRIFTAAKHPKSFISLDSADHLLSSLSDAQYVANTIAAWASRYLPEPETIQPHVAGGEIYVGEGNQRFLREVASDDHAWLADEPKRVGGDNLGPDPYEHLLAALGTCTSMTVRMYANRKKWPLEDIDITLSHGRDHVDDCARCEEGPMQIDVIRRVIALDGPLDDEQRRRLIEIADRCPVHKTLQGEIRIETS